ncbi:MAG: hypothetical protein JWP76_4290 [Dactylosporangium sp.]|jgi:hypothetical protein|nr:hypothetical protein [Dactylosporangium sp.]
MIDMAGKRLAAAGVLAAAVAATAALWVAQHTPLPSQLRAIRQTQATIAAVDIAHVPLAHPPSQLLVQPPLALTVTGGLLLGLVLLGTVPRQRRAAVHVTAQPPRRGRAPPSSGYRTARTRGH